LINVRRQNRCVEPVIDRIREGKINPDFLITHRFSLDQAVQAFELLADYRDELRRQTRELQKAAGSNAPEEAQAYVQLSFSAGAVEAIVRYPVPFQRAAELEERMSRELLEAVRPSSAHPAELAAQPA
jgi:hypothetical protein